MTHEPSTHPAFDTQALPSAVARVATSVVGLATPRDEASGWVWQPGVVVTSAAAVWHAKAVHVVLPSGESIAAELRGADASTDLAVLTFAPSGMPAAPTQAAPHESQVGDFVFAVGREASGRIQASFGHVGAAGGEWRTWRGGRVESLIRLDGGLYPGLAGAPVANAQGMLLGIASPALSRHHGVVLPLATIARIVPTLLAHGHVPQAYLGVAAQPVQTQLDGVATAGILVSSVAEGSPAAAAGVLVGDVLTHLNAEAVPNLETLRDRLAAAGVGASLAATLVRGGQVVQITLAVAQRTEAPRAGCGPCR